MELLETQDPEKRKLIETSDRHKRELEREVSEISARTEKVLTNALIIGGSLAITYFVVSRFAGSGKKANREKAKPRIADLEEDEDESEEISHSSSLMPAIIAQVGAKVINQATLILLDMAREKLFEYLHSRNSKDENS